MHVIGKLKCTLLSLMISLPSVSIGDVIFEYDSSFDSTINTLHPSAEIISPSASFVIEQEDIKRSSANTLAELLSVVPGIHVGGYGELHAPLFILRGMSSRVNPQVLFMINGVQITSPYRGDQHVIWGAYLIKSIERIEIIRGPNSAVQGANAMTGVINIITKSYSGDNVSHAGMSFGTNDEINTWFLKNFKFKGTEVSLNGELSKSDGRTFFVSNDNQTYYDLEFDKLYADGVISFNPEDASLANKNVSLGYEVFDLWGSINTSKWNVNIGFQNRNNVEPGINQLNTIIENGNTMESYRFVGKFKTHPVSITETDNLQFNASYYEADQSGSSTNQLLPPGAYAGAFPDGMIGAPFFNERRVETNVLFTRELTEASHMALSLGYTFEEIYDIEEYKNFVGNAIPRPEGLIDVSEDPNEIFMAEVSRNFLSFSGEHIQYIGDELELTTGLRVDDYSDFGSQISPRVALTWHYNHDISVTSSLSKAYRAPTFSELYTKNNPVSLGDPKLSPETIINKELNFRYQPNKDSSLNVDIYYFTIHDFIEYIRTEGQPILSPKNFGEFNGYGFEVSYKNNITELLSLNANYSHNEIKNSYGSVTNQSIQNIEDDNYVFKVGEYPDYQWVVAFTYNPSEDLNMGVSVEGVGEVNKTGDYKDNTLPSFEKVNLFLAKTNRNILIKLSVRNLLDDREHIPTDIKSFEHPREIQTIRGAGRELTLGIQYQF